MKAGRDLDIAVAEKIFGWRKSISPGYGVIYYPPGPPEMNVLGHEIPHYSTDIKAAWEVFEKANLEALVKTSKGYHAKVMRKELDDNFEREEFKPFDPDGYYEIPIYADREIIAETPALAICLAALAAVEKR